VEDDPFQRERLADRLKRKASTPVARSISLWRRIWSLKQEKQ
jgi:hypothetical protein